MNASMRELIGRFRIVKHLGEGAMGVVYAAHDPSLDRPVAIKMIHAANDDPRARDRLWREARSAASINHPNVCQIYEVGEDKGELFLAMELLEGESLAARIARGPLPIADGLQIATGILAALEALHRRDLVHRDLKPSNVFLTPHGVKLLDFGLARPLAMNMAGPADGTLTVQGTIVGTPAYMAPEQWTGEAVGPPADIFAFGSILFEMLTGRRAFTGDSLLELHHAVVHGQPPALSGGRSAMAADRVIQRALAKQPSDRYPDAGTMAVDVRAALAVVDPHDAPRALATKRLIVLPFRCLRPDPDTDFLAFGLADAITGSLTGLESLVVRSSIAASRFADNPDLKAIATEAQVDAVVHGTLYRAGDRLRVAAQLVAVPSGTILWSKSAQVEIGDLFQIQDDLAREIIESLSIPLSSRDDGRLKHDTPGSSEAYELYLRANQLASNSGMLPVARDLYRRCLDVDPNYAPAWARLGRVYRVMAKYAQGDVSENAELAASAFRKALDLHPDLSLAHNLYTYFEIDDLGRPLEAMVRLLDRAQQHATDPELFAGLVVACRFGGLLDASIAADRRAKRLDPGIRTSAAFTYLAAGDYERALLHDDEAMRFVTHYALPMLGREQEVIDSCREIEARQLKSLEHHITVLIRTALEGDREGCLAASKIVLNSSFRDPEGIYYLARSLVHVGATELALAALDRVVMGGFACYTTFVRDPWLDPLRTTDEFRRILQEAGRRHRAAASAFTEAGGERLLGVATH
jgi:TolB-like protein